MQGQTPSGLFGGAAEVSAQGVAGAMGFDSVDDLLKAMSVGSTFPAGIGAMTPGALMATVPQDLDDVLHNAAFDETAVILWNKLAKDRVFSTVHQYVRKQSPGSAGRRFLFHPEGGLPVESDTTYSLEQLAMRYLGAVRRLPIQARLVTSIAGNTVKAQNRDGALEILSALEYHLFYGNPLSNPFAFEGLHRAMHREGIILDANGALPTEAIIDEAMELVTERPNWGKPTDMFCSPRMHKTLRQLYAARMRSMMGAQFHPNYTLREMTFDHCIGDEKVGIVKHPLALGEKDVCVELGMGTDPSKRPVAPIIFQQPAAAANPASLFVAAGPKIGGTFIYRIVAMNESGWSTPVTTNAVVTAAGDANTLIVTDAAVPGSTQRATGYIIYRTLPGAVGPSATQIREVAATAGGGNTTFVDLNQDLPGTSDIFIISNRQQSLGWKQLLPFFNFPLGNLDTSYRWALLLFGALQVSLPRHHALIKNVAVDTTLDRQLAEAPQDGPQQGI